MNRHLITLNKWFFKAWSVWCRVERTFALISGCLLLSVHPSVNGYLTQNWGQSGASKGTRHSSVQRHESARHLPTMFSPYAGFELRLKLTFYSPQLGHALLNVSIFCNSTFLKMLFVHIEPYLMYGFLIFTGHVWIFRRMPNHLKFLPLSILLMAPFLVF